MGLVSPKLEGMGRWLDQSLIVFRCLSYHASEEPSLDDVPYEYHRVTLEEGIWWPAHFEVGWSHGEITALHFANRQGRGRKLGGLLVLRCRTQRLSLGSHSFQATVI